MCLGTCNRAAAECRYMERGRSRDDPGSVWSCNRDQEECLLACPGAYWVDSAESGLRKTHAARARAEAAAREGGDGGKAEGPEAAEGEPQ